MEKVPKRLRDDGQARRRFVFQQVRAAEVHNKTVEVNRMWQELKALKEEEQRTGSQDRNRVPTPDLASSRSFNNTYKSQNRPALSKETGSPRSHTGHKPLHKIDAQERDSWEEERLHERKRKHKLQKRLFNAEDADMRWRPDLYYTEILKKRCPFYRMTDILKETTADMSSRKSRRKSSS